MATWFAQASSVNINRVSGGTTSDVWNDAADGSGNWMDVSVLTAGGSDTVLCANAKTSITINLNLDIGTGRITTVAEGAGAAGGGFRIDQARTLICNAVAGTSMCLYASGGPYAWSLTGNTTGGTASNSYGVDVGGPSTLSFAGNATAGSGINSYGMFNESTGTVNMTGNATGGSNSNARGVYNASTGTVDITGNVEGGTVSGTTNGVYTNNASGVTIIRGNVLNTTGRACGFGGFSPQLIPGAANYIRNPSGAGTQDFPRQLAAENIKMDVVSGTVTGTYEGGGGGGAVRIESLGASVGG